MSQQPEARLRRLYTANKLSSIGSIIILLNTLAVKARAAASTQGAYYFVNLSAVIGLVMSGLAIYFSIRLYKLYSSARSGTLSDVSAIRRTGMVLLILSIIGLFIIGLIFIHGSFINFIFLILVISLWGGSFIGFTLLLIGSILAIKWKP
jgi:hypothetical protein